MVSRNRDWAPLDFAEDPTPGDVDGVVAVMDDVRRRADWLRHRADAGQRSLDTLSPGAWSGLAADMARKRMTRLRDAARTAADHHREAGDSLQEWVEALSDAQFRADRALNEAEEAQAEIALAEAAVAVLGAEHKALVEALTGMQKTFSRYLNDTPPPGTKVPSTPELAAARQRAEDANAAAVRARKELEAAEDRLSRARNDAREARDAYEQAEDRFARRLEATMHGRLGHATAPELAQFRSGVSALASAEKWGGLTPTNPGALLKRLTPEELEALLKQDPELLQNFWDNPPEPNGVAAWWDGLDSATRKAFIQAAAGVIGNLPGIPYADRNTANRISLDQARKNPHLTADERKVLDAMGAALRAPADDVPVQIVSFNFFTKPPMLAVGYGDLDHCLPTTWCAGGMGFGAKDALEDWSTAAKNLWLAQNGLGVDMPGVVACFEYDNPDMWGVLNSDAAKNGAPRFAAELDGNAAVRSVGGKTPASISVTAHSYGTTMTAIALTKVKTTIDSYVMVGSAGIDTSLVPSLSDIRAKHVYTTAASADGLAPFGAAASGRANPNPEVTHLNTPTIGGAKSFSADGEGKKLAPVDGHNPLGKPGSSSSGGFLNAEPSAHHGYYDQGTQSLKNMAAVTTGRLRQLSGPLTDTGPGAARHDLGTLSH